MNHSIKLLITFLVALTLWFVPPPEGLSIEAWHTFAIYLAAIIGLVIKPFPAPVVLLIAVGATALLLDETSTALSGYSSSITWLVFSAFTLSIAFIKTGLGRRLAYILIDKLGGTTLGLGYVTAFLDLGISPVTPSNTARCGGIVYPIIHSIVKALGSEPGETAKKAGSYLMINTYMVTKVTSFMFLTAMAPNALAADQAEKILGIHIDWMIWFKGLFLPGFFLLLLIPLVNYIMTRPTLTKVDNKKISAEGLAELGPMKMSEKILVTIFALSLTGWIAPTLLNLLDWFDTPITINATAVAICAMVAILVTNVIQWSDVQENKGGWNTFIWFGGIIGISAVLTKLGFFVWLADFMGKNINFGDNALLILWFIIFLSVIVRYLFASGSAYIAAMLPVFLTVGKVAGAPEMALALALCASNAYGGSLTHYTGAAAPIVFGAGYNTIKQWWIIGAFIAIICYLFMMTLGMAWWQLIGLI